MAKKFVYLPLALILGAAWWWSETVAERESSCRENPGCGFCVFVSFLQQSWFWSQESASEISTTTEWSSWKMKRRSSEFPNLQENADWSMRHVSDVFLGFHGISEFSDVDRTVSQRSLNHICTKTERGYSERTTFWMMHTVSPFTIFSRAVCWDLRPYRLLFLHRLRCVEKEEKGRFCQWHFAVTPCVFSQFSRECGPARYADAVLWLGGSWSVLHPGKPNGTGKLICVESEWKNGDSLWKLWITRRKFSRIGNI